MEVSVSQMHGGESNSFPRRGGAQAGVLVTDGEVAFREAAFREAVTDK